MTRSFIEQGIRPQVANDSVAARYYVTFWHALELSGYKVQRVEVGLESGLPQDAAAGPLHYLIPQGILNEVSRLPETELAYILPRRPRHHIQGLGAQGQTVVS
jgi:hypothetical protein